MYCGIINSVTKLHLVGYCYWVTKNMPAIHILYLCILYDLKINIVSLYSINWLVFLMEAHHIIEVQTKYLFIIWITFSLQNGWCIKSELHRFDFLLCLHRLEKTALGKCEVLVFCLYTGHHHHQHHHICPDNLCYKTHKTVVSLTYRKIQSNAHIQIIWQSLINCIPTKING